MSKRKHEGGDGEAVKKQCTVLIVEPCKAMVVWEPPFDMERYNEDYEWRLTCARELLLDGLHHAYGIMEQLKDDYYLVYGPPAKCGCGHSNDEIAPRYWFAELAFREFFTRPREQWEKAHGRVPTPPPHSTHTANAATQDHHPSSCICHVGSPAHCVGQATAAPATFDRSR